MRRDRIWTCDLLVMGLSGRLFRSGMPIGPFMLHCNRQIAAMQTNALLLVSGIHKLSPDDEAADRCAPAKGTPMSKTASLALAPTNSLFGRFLALVDRLLMKSAEISNRNGDLPRFGL